MPTRHDLSRSAVGRLLPALLTGVLLSVVSGPSVGAQEPIKRALIVYTADKGMDKANMAKILTAMGWRVAVLKVASPGTEASELKIRQTMRAWFDTPGGNEDPKLFYYSGHGFIYKNANGQMVDEPPVDEGGLVEELVSGIRRDDNLGTAWAGMEGVKILIYQSCRGGGMFDGSSDPRPGNAEFFASAGPADLSSQDTRVGGVFTWVIRRALGLGDSNSDGQISLGEFTTYVLGNFPPSTGPAWWSEVPPEDHYSTGAPSGFLIGPAQPLLAPAVPVEAPHARSSECDVLTEGSPSPEPTLPPPPPVPAASAGQLGALGALLLAAGAYVASRDRRT